jgi:hypothetical protein
MKITKGFNIQGQDAKKLYRQHQTSQVLNAIIPDSLSTALREFLHFRNLVSEIRVKGFKMEASIPTARCQAFKDNLRMLESATVHGLQSQAKPLTVKCHQGQNINTFIDSMLMEPSTPKPLIQSINKHNLLTKPSSEIFSGQ